MTNEYPAARAWLSRAGNLSDEIKRKKARIENLRDAGNNTTVQISDMPRNPSPNNHRMEDLVAKIIDLESEVQESECRLDELRAEMVMCLNEWLDPEQAMLLSRRYADLISWDTLADDLNCTTRRLYQIHRNALGQLEERLKIDVDTSAHYVDGLG